MVVLSSVFLSSSVTIGLFLELCLLLILSYTLIQTVFILKSYKKDEITDIQNYVEKKSYLVSTLVSVSLVVKILLVAFFTYALDELAYVVPGAMCATGVLNTSSYGEVLIYLKLLILVSSSLWLLLNKADLSSKDGEHFKKKMYLFIVLYIFIFGELILSLAFFSSIDTQIPVACCAYKYVEVTNTLPFGLAINTLVGLFYSLYIVMVLSAYKKQKLLLLLASSIYVYISFYLIVYYFGGYIYDDISHNCPYCMLQQKYNYVGYFIYISLFVSIIYTLGYIIFDFMAESYNKVILWFSVFVLILSSYLLT